MLRRASAYAQTGQNLYCSHTQRLDGDKGSDQNLDLTAHSCNKYQNQGAQWLSGRVLDSRPRGRGFEPHRHHWARHIYPSLVLVQTRKIRPCLTERLLMEHKESNQTNQNLIYLI